MVLKLDLHDDKAEEKDMEAVSSLSAIDSIAMNKKEKKLTVFRRLNPVNVMGKLRKLWRKKVNSVQPAKDPEKKKEEPQKEPTKEEKQKDPNEQIAELVKAYYRNSFHMTTH